MWISQQTLCSESLTGFKYTCCELNMFKFHTISVILNICWTRVLYFMNIFPWKVFGIISFFGVPPLLPNLEKWFFFLHLKHSFQDAGHSLGGCVWPQLKHLFPFLSQLWDLPWLDLEWFCLLWLWECLVTLCTLVVIFPNLPTFWSNCFDKVSVWMMDLTVLPSCRIPTKASVIFIFSINWSLTLSLVLWIRNTNLTISSLFSKLQPFTISRI